MGGGAVAFACIGQNVGGILWSITEFALRQSRRARKLTKRLGTRAIPRGRVVAAHVCVGGGPVRSEFTHRETGDGVVVGRHVSDASAAEGRVGIHVNDARRAKEARRQVHAIEVALHDAADRATTTEKRRYVLRARRLVRNDFGLPAKRGGVASDAGGLHPLDVLPGKDIEVEDCRLLHHIIHYTILKK